VAPKADRAEPARYRPGEVEARWQRFWSEQATFRAERRPGREKRYVLDMFPYPSAAGPATKNALQILSRESPSDRLSNRRRATSFGSSLASAGTSLRLWSRSTSTAISSSTKTRRRSPARSRPSLPVTTSPPPARCAARGPADLSQEKWRTRHDSNVRPAE